MPQQNYSSIAAAVNPTADAADSIGAAPDLPTTTAKAQKQAISGAETMEAKTKKAKTINPKENNKKVKGRKAQKGKKQGGGSKNKKHDDDEAASATLAKAALETDKAKAVLETSGINKYGENLVTLSDDGSTNSDGGSTNENCNFNDRSDSDSDNNSEDNHSNNSGVNKKGTLISKASTPTYAEVLMANTITTATIPTSIATPVAVLKIGNITSTSIISETSTASTDVASIIAETSTISTDVPMNSPPHTPPRKTSGNTAEDVIMMSPPLKTDDLKGASRVTGGIFCGQAVGNVQNIADLSLERSYSPVFEMGEVQYFVSDQNPGNLTMANMKPVLVADTPIAETIQPILESLSQKYSPGKDNQGQIYLFDHKSNHWKTPHTTATAISDNESGDEEKEIPWLKLAQLLGVNESFLSDASQKCSGLPLAYGCYKAYLNAHRAFDQLTASGKWPSKYKLPVEEDIIGLFIGKTTFYDNYCPLFSKLPDYPNMVQWLNGETHESDNEDIDVWAGYNKKQCTFVDLQKWLNDQQPTKQNGKKKADNPGEKRLKNHKKAKKGLYPQVSTSEDDSESDEHVQRNLRKKKTQ
ncbi:hypothetical protein BDQ12DRAFT_666787 [Crucibulum laeve]|uniref:Uncharacterized protein n=1 Tax=Crucibulum laeve TaxID=68775 RepID=A0A5C3M0M5_9AGAR|nr:hypothetical protein BDQ12DRAFT_666787 [Crucibulum laeve]